MTPRQQFDFALYCARVYRGMAADFPSLRVYWLRAALDSYQDARRHRAAMGAL